MKDARRLLFQFDVLTSDSLDLEDLHVDLRILTFGPLGRKLTGIQTLFLLGVNIIFLHSISLLERLVLDFDFSNAGWGYHIGLLDPHSRRFINQNRAILGDGLRARFKICLIHVP